MKKILGIVVLSLLISGNAYAGKKDVGKGELIFQDWLVDYFYKYIIHFILLYLYMKQLIQLHFQ